MSEIQAWRDRAACKGMPPEIFFPERGGTTTEAKAVCATCTVTSECLDFALDHMEKIGVWGGKSEKQRRKIRSDNYRAERGLGELEPPRSNTA